MSRINLAFQSSLVLIITIQGFVSAQTRTAPRRQDAVTSQQERSPSRMSQTETPIEANLYRYQEQDFGLEPSPNEAKRFYKQGVKYGRMKLYNEAVAAFELAILLKPNYGDAYFGLGHAYFDLRRWKEAIQAFRRVVQLDPKDNEAYARLQESYDKLAAQEKAIVPPERKAIQNKTVASERVSLDSRSQPKAANLSNSANRISGTAVRESAYSTFKQPAGQPKATSVPVKNSVPNGNVNKNFEAGASRSSTNPPLKVPAAKTTPVKQQALPKTSPELRQASDGSRQAGSSPNPPANMPAKIVSTPKSQVAANTPSLTKSSLEFNPVSKAASDPRTIPSAVKNSVSLDTANKNVKTPASTTANPAVDAATVNKNNKNVKTPAPTTANPAVDAAKATPVDRKADIEGSQTSSNTRPDLSGPALRVPPSVETSSAGATGVAGDATATSKTVSEGTSDASSSSPKPSQSSEVAIYRIGIGDVLDVRVNDSPVNSQTLFTVSAGGLLDYPVLDQHLGVLGLTTDEVGEKLKNEFKRRALNEGQKISVAVHDYNSHTILVSGLVNEQGTKMLRREAIPLYVVLAEAQPLPEAGRVTIISQAGSKSATVDLAAPEATGLLIHPGDVVIVQSKPKLFFYIGGDVKEPGEKPYRQDLKLTQAILKAGGLNRVSKAAELAREGANGLLEVSTYKLTDISSGKLPDPSIQPGDRITIIH